jgi:acyl-coenzyme A synthetase/AMP-(fatty) acid ligase
MLQLSAGASWTEATLRDALRDQLAPFKIPQRVRFVDQLPRPHGEMTSVPACGPTERP